MKNFELDTMGISQTPEFGVAQYPALTEALGAGPESPLQQMK
jgi:hypothetical protein